VNITNAHPSQIGQSAFYGAPVADDDLNGVTDDGAAWLAWLDDLTTRLYNEHSDAMSLEDMRGLVARAAERAGEGRIDDYRQLFTERFANDELRATLQQRPEPPGERQLSVRPAVGHEAGRTP